MIFVTLGTSSFPFQRLVRNLYQLEKKGVLKETVILQAGVTPAKKTERIIPSAFLPFEKMVDNFQKARIVITHATASSVFLAIKFGEKIPIVVPRRKRWREHVDDHQVEFAQFLEERGLAIVVNKTTKLEEAVKNYSRLQQGKRGRKSQKSSLEKLVSRLTLYTQTLK